MAEIKIVPNLHFLNRANMAETLVGQ